MYEQYLNMPSVPVGFFIKRIMDKIGLTQSQLSETTGIIKQRLYDYINNKRKISVETSFLLEDAFGMTPNGFFYKLQANHDIYTCMREKELKLRPNLELFRKALFWDVDIENIDWKSQKDWVIKRIFEYGNDTEIQAAIDYYGKDSILSVLNAIESNWKQDTRLSNIEKFLK